MLVVIFKRAVTAILFILVCARLHAQTANFTLDKIGGCSPLTVTFTNTTQGASASATYKWDFGNGNSVTKSNTGSVGATYDIEKTYTVSLTVTDNGTSNTKTSTITVYKKPTAAFIVNNTKGCIPYGTTFNSNSVAGDGTISNYLWDFGDGTTAKETQPSNNHSYNNIGKFTVSLTVTNSFGCQSSPVSKANAVEAIDSIKVIYDADKTVLCKTNETVAFTNNSTGTGPFTYAWNFGDGGTSVQATPLYTYKTKGIYTVKLKVNGAFGCTSQLEKTDFINAANFTSNFSTNPAIVCANQNINFLNNSSPFPTSALFYISTDNFQNGYFGSYTFPNKGSYKVRLINSFGACLDTIEKNVSVNNGLALDGFIIGNASLCGAPTNVSFKDTTAAAVKWAWDFNYFGSPNTEATTQTASHNYLLNNSYTIYLEVADAAGCTASVTKNILINKPNVNINYSTKTGLLDSCVGLNVAFSANSQPAVIAHYFWDFGDGFTSTDATPNHVFAKAGVYNVQLNYTTKDSCKGSTTLLDPVRVADKPVAKFAVSDTLICGNLDVKFADSSTVAGLVNSWSWNFGENDAFSNNQNPVHRYKDTGYYTITFIAFTNGCSSDTIIKTNYIHVLPPFAIIDNAANTCSGTRGLVSFTEKSRMAEKLQWNFGDGKTSASLLPPANTSHTYTKSGEYKVLLTATNKACIVSDSITVYVLLKQTPVLTASKSSVCTSDIVDVQGNGFEMNPTNSGYALTWQYGDGTAFSGNASIDNQFWQTNYNGTLSNFKNGVQTLRFISVSNYFNCNDTSNFVPFVTKGPVAKFSISNGNRCFKKPIVFTDASTSTNAAPIVKWDWNFGDGNTQTSTINGNTNHLYGIPNNFYAILKVTDSDGCFNATDDFAQNVDLKGPKADFYWAPFNVAPGTSATFYNNSNINNTGNANYIWHFSSNRKTDTDAFSVTQNYPNKILIDTVTLIATNTETTCTDTVVRYVPVKNVNARFTFSTEYTNLQGCPPLLAHFVSNTLNVTRIAWNFGDGSGSVDNFNPSHTYNQPGKYLVTIYGYDQFNNVDSSSDTITVKGPLVDLRVDVLQSCAPLLVNFSAKTTNVATLIWDFGDGTLTPASTDTFAHYTYTNPGLYTPALIVQDTSQCKATFRLSHPILADSLHVNFTISNNPICDSGLIRFTPNVFSIGADKLQQTLNYRWNFGTGKKADTSTVADPAFFYNHIGKDTVKLQMQSPAGCIAFASDTILVKQSSKGFITGPSVLCEEKTALFSATPNVPSNSIAWQWNFNNGKTDTVQNPAVQNFVGRSEPYNISLVTLYNGCYDTTTTLLTVHAKPFINASPKLSTICRKESIQLTALDGVTYKWTPNIHIRNAANAITWVHPDTSTQYKVQVTNSFGCVNTDSVTVNVVQPVQLKLPLDTFVCEGSRVQVTVSGAESYRWINHLTDISDTLSPNPFINPKLANGAFNIYTVVGSNNCFNDTAAIKITVQPLPTVSAGTNLMLNAGTSTTLNAKGSADIFGYEWIPTQFLSCSNCASPICTPRDTITYTVTATTKYGCKASASLFVGLLCRGNTLAMPSAFTPNNMPPNDIYYPMGRGIKTVKRFQIFNRAGQVVFEKVNFNINDPSFGWNGKLNYVEMPAGTYIYNIAVICDTNESFSANGTIVLIR